MRLLTILTALLNGCTPPRVEPMWTLYRPLREVGNLGPVVTDIESHLAAGHPYRDSDRIGWVHEGTQGLAGQLRNQYHRPGFYVLRDRAVLMPEPVTTLSAVAAQVPVSLRGPGYDLYLIQQQAYFEDQPTYVFDEWVAYTNGSEARQRLGIQARGETVVSMLEFIPYALCVPQASGSHNPQMRAFIQWQIERNVTLASGVPSTTLDRLRTAADASTLRQFARTYFGADWTRRVLEF